MYDSDYPGENNFETERFRSRILVRFRRKQFVYSFLFVMGTIIAGAAWYAEWMRWALVPFMAWLPIAGHALQVVGAFGSLLTPDYIEEDEDA